MARGRGRVTERRVAGFATTGGAPAGARFLLAGRWARFLFISTYPIFSFIFRHRLDHPGFTPRSLPERPRGIRVCRGALLRG